MSIDLDFNQAAKYERQEIGEAAQMRSFCAQVQDMVRQIRTHDHQQQLVDASRKLVQAGT